MFASQFDGRGLNAAVCDSVMVAFYRNWEKRKTGLKDRFDNLLGSHAFDEYVSSSTTDVDTVKQRIKLAEHRLFA
jgi:hypothetical protein